MNSSLRNVYQRIILEHNARPKNFGPLPSSTHQARAHNALCGDEVILRLRLEGGRIAEVRFEGNGCALSRASASLMTIAIEGRSLEEEALLSAELSKLLSRAPEGAPADATLLGGLMALEGVRDVPSRLRCATLPWEALRSALAGTVQAS